MKKLLLGTAFATFAAAGGAMADGHSTTVCLITKTDTNPFFVKMKELTVLGYFTSELAAQTELDYQPVPGSYDGDALFDDTGRQWVR